MEADSNQDKKYSGEKAQSQRKQNAGKEAEAAPATSSPPFLLRRFERLPDEILVDILLGLPTASLIQITLVSHRFNAVSGEAWKRLCIQRYHNLFPKPRGLRLSLNLSDFDRLLLGGSEIVQDLGKPNLLYATRRPKRDSLKTISPRLSTASSSSLTAPPGPRPVSSSEDDSESASSDLSKSTSKQRSKSDKRFAKSKSKGEEEFVFTPGINILRRKDSATPSAPGKGKEKGDENLDFDGVEDFAEAHIDGKRRGKAKEKAKGKGKEKAKRRLYSSTSDGDGDLEEFVEEDGEEDDINKGKEPMRPDGTSDELYDDRVGWKFVYYNKTRIENIRWLIKREPIWSTQFYTMEEARIGASPDTIHKYHLFPTVVKFHQGHVIVGSGAYEAVSDPTTFMVGNRLIRVFDRQTGVVVRQLDGHSGAVLSLDCSDDYILSTSRSKANNLILWDWTSGQNVTAFHGHKTAVFQASFAENDRIISCSKDRSVRIWNLHDGQRVAKYKIFSDAVKCYEHITPSSLACAVDDKHLDLLDLNAGAVITRFDVPKPINALRIHQNTAVTAIANSIRQIDLRSGEIVRTISKKSYGSSIGGAVRELYVDDDKLLFTTTEGKFGIVDWNTANILAFLPLAQQRMTFAYDAQTQKVVIGDSHSWLKLYDFGDQEHRIPIKVDRAHHCTIA